ncbi:MAG: TRAP transporter small permease [bacterium]|nr:MAG: TRAP transporter small permease [bacterium]
MEKERKETGVGKGDRKGALDRAFVGANKALIGVMMVVMFILVFANVVTRYLFGISIATTDEVSTFLMIWVTYLGAGLALREGRHAAIDLFQDMLPEGARHIFRAILGVVILAFFAILAYFGVRFAIFGWGQETAVTQIPKGVIYLAIPSGAALFAVHLVTMFPRWIRRDWGVIAGHEDEAGPKGGEGL